MGFKGAASGALSGGAAGSVFGPWGSAIGAGIGGLFGGFGGDDDDSGSSGSYANPKKISTMDSKQKKLYKAQFDALKGKGKFKDLYRFDPKSKAYKFDKNSDFYKFNKKSKFYNYDAESANQNFDQMYSRPAYRAFEENIIPSITGQFRSANLMNSSYAGDALGKAGRDVQESLDAQRGNMIYQGVQQADQRKYNDYNAIQNRKYNDYSNLQNKKYNDMNTTIARKDNAIGNLLNNSSFAYQQPGARQPGLVDQILGQVGPAAGSWFADYLKSSGGSPSKSTSLFGSNQLG